MEDNCESLGSKIGLKSLGSFGFASSHSFYFGHHISTIEEVWFLLMTNLFII